MGNELIEHLMFVQQIPPFDTLPKATVQQLVKNITITYVTAEQELTTTASLKGTKRGVSKKTEWRRVIWL